MRRREDREQVPARRKVHRTARSIGLEPVFGHVRATVSIHEVPERVDAAGQAQMAHGREADPTDGIREPNGRDHGDP